MKTKLSHLGVALALVVALAMPAMAAGEITVGGFVQAIAKAKNLNATDASIAVDALAAAGITLPADLNMNGQLTEGDVARISQSLGLNVNTSRPSANFTRAQVNRYFRSFEEEIGFSGGGGAVAASGTPAFDPFSKGNGKSKGKGKGHTTPTEPE
ncbi:MAG: hypothetical protein OEV00_11385 [Acidobacteriota bacterium]|nr:hypothetical protein [Acidobacteriota bacterium]MDH3785916.1 hypothetical protein [Acidobacteriota bacterium]